MKYYVNSFKLEEMMENLSPIFSFKISRKSKEDDFIDQIERIKYDIYDLKSRYKKRNEPSRSSHFWFEDSYYNKSIRTEYAFRFIFEFLILKFPEHKDDLLILKNEDKIQKIFQENKNNLYDMSKLQETIKNKNELEKFTEDVIFNDELFQIEFEEDEYNKILRTITYSTLLVKGLEEISTDFDFIVCQEHPLLIEFTKWFNNYVDLEGSDIISNYRTELQLLEEEKEKLYQKINQLESNNI